MQSRIPKIFPWLPYAEKWQTRCSKGKDDIATTKLEFFRWIPDGDPEFSTKSSFISRQKGRKNKWSLACGATLGAVTSATVRNQQKVLFPRLSEEASDQDLDDEAKNDGEKKSADDKDDGGDKNDRGGPRTVIASENTSF